MSQLIPSTTHLRTFGDHTIHAVAIFPDRRRMIAGSQDKSLRMWDLDTSVMLTKVRVFAVLWDGQMVVGTRSSLPGKEKLVHGVHLSAGPLAQPT